MQGYPEFRDLILTAVLPGGPDDPAAPPVAPVGADAAAAAGLVAHLSDQIDPPRGHDAAAGAARASRQPSALAPHINLDAGPRPSIVWEVVKWLALVAVIVGSAAAAYYLLPDVLFRGRWWWR